MGCSVYLPNTLKRLRGFDLFGFAFLALGVGALQMMLDRGVEVDWFCSTEIWIELGLALTGFWVFVVHILRADQSFLEPRMFRDRNFVTGLVFIFIIGIILLSSLALLPPMLARIYGYPTLDIGVIIAPRGVGTMISMLIVGRLVRIVDARVLILSGLALTSLSLWIMTGFSPLMGVGPIISSGIIQGLGLGLVFVPLSTVAFASVAPHFRADATALFSLVRNIGSSIGSSVVLARNLQINHMELGWVINPFNPVLQSLLPDADNGQAAALTVVDGLVSTQARMISYLDDFRLMMLVSLAAMPMVIFLRRAKPSAGPASAAHAD